MADTWKLNGQYMEACNCKPACPCIFLSTPTEGDCTALVGWHIDQGNFGSTDLSGLNVAMAVYSPGNMVEGKWRAALYVDARASETQKNSLIQIFGGQAGGHPARLASFVGEILGVASVPIEYQANGKHRSLRVEASRMPTSTPSAAEPKLKSPWPITRSASRPVIRRWLRNRPACATRITVTSGRSRIATACTRHSPIRLRGGAWLNLAVCQSAGIA